jgi:hypothetical protein
MATSGTWAFDLDLTDIVEEAFERIGSEARSGYDYRTARRSLDLLLLEWQNRGLNLWTMKSASQTLTAGTASYALAAERVDIIEGMLRTDAGDTSKQTDLTMRRISGSRYAQQTNKLATGRPIQFWVARSPDAVTVTVWPVPDSAQTYVFHYYYLERIEDAGTPGTNTVDVPARHYPALVAGLAYYLRQKKPDSPVPLADLEAIYERQWMLASDAVREKASLRIVPRTY